LLTGQAAFGLDQREMGQKDLEKGEVFGVPIALVILIVVLGAIVAAVMPLVLAAVSIVVALGVSALVGQAFQLSFFVENIITMIGLAVGIDYSLFVVSRYREERAHGVEKIAAIGRAGATATRAVVFSGMTVVLALIGMLLIPFNIFIGVGAGAILVVMAAMLASLTLLPALLGLLGDGINRLSIPLIGRSLSRYDAARGGGIWDRISRTVMRRPVISLVLVVGILLAAAFPFLDLNSGFAGISTLPDGIESKEAFLILDEEFSAGEVTPAEIVIDGDTESPAVQEGISRLAALMAQDGAFGRPRPLQVNEAGDLALLSVPVKGDASTDASLDAVTRLRRQYVPEAFSGVPAEVLVSGETAFNIDFFELASDSARIVFPFVLGVSFLLLVLVFRSVVVPFKAILMNLLSVGAAYGLLVLVFQKGWLNSQLGFSESPIIEAWIPLFLFSILFGLSMDYHVFLLSRIRERFDQTRDNTESIAFGIRSTGRLITGAALIMVAVFWGFAAGDLVGLQQMGFGLGIAILLDATLVRMVLVPASMRLLGRWNWYLPSWLEWMPDVRVEAERSRA
jgi:RND superfamily putative drug exporter